MDIKLLPLSLKSIKLLLSFLSLFSFGSYAHVPHFLDADPSKKNPHILKRPYQQSIAIYTEFDSQNDIDVYQFTLTQEDLKQGAVETLIGSLVPACKPLEKLLTNVLLIGPQQEGFTLIDHNINDLLDIPQDQYGVLLKNEKQTHIWEEPYTAHYYFRHKRQKLNLTKDGVYTIYVWGSGQGDYVFEFGDDEIWPLKDILYTLWVYPKLLLELEISTKDCKTSPMEKK